MFAGLMGWHLLIVMAVVLLIVAVIAVVVIAVIVVARRAGARPSAVIAAGWYPDPSRAGMQRYWDGTNWTASTDAPAPPGH